MKKLVTIVVVLCAALPLAQAKEPKKTGSSAVTKDLMKDAVDTSSGQPAPARGAIDPNAKPPPDVTKMPFTQGSIKAVIAYHHPQIQACYEETLASKEKVLEGKLLTSFVITPEGVVKDAKILKKGTTLKEPKVHECVTTVLSTMTFPKPADGLDHPIEFPFNLKAIQ
jgi:hypothetical protein